MMTITTERIEGVVIGAFLGFGENASPLVVFPGNPEETALPARSLCELTSDMIGCEVALLFQDGDVRRPLIVGRVVEPAGSSPAHVTRDGERIIIAAKKRIELRCGKSTIIMEEDGRITIRGANITSHASRGQRIRGGTINLN